MCVRREFFGELKPLKVVALTGLLTVTIRLIPTSLFNYDIPPKKTNLFHCRGILQNIFSLYCDHQSSRWTAGDSCFEDLSRSYLVWIVFVSQTKLPHCSIQQWLEFKRKICCTISTTAKFHSTSRAASLQDQPFQVWSLLCVISSI